MAPQPASGPLVPVLFDARAQAFLDEDAAHHPETARQALADFRRDTERAGGVAIGQLRRCDAHGRDGTELPNCMKLYLPAPAGRWGLVLVATEHPTRPWALLPIAFGARHPTGRRPSVYHIAHRRLHDE